jgi:hypothetical protein
VTSHETAAILASLTTAQDATVTMESLAQDCVALVPADRVSLTLMAAGRREAASASSDAVATAVQDAELTLGEGPGTDAYSSGTPVQVADVSTMNRHWPHYVRAAEHAGVRGVYAFPLRLGAVRVGLLTLYRGAPHTLTSTEFATSLAVAEALTQVLVGLQSGGNTETLVAALEDGAAFRSVVHQATGAVAAQLGCSLEEALVRLRGTAFAADRTLPEVAAAVIAGRLRIEGS